MCVICQPDEGLLKHSMASCTPSVGTDLVPGGGTLQVFACLLLLTKNRAVRGYRMLAFRVVFEYLQVRSREGALRPRTRQPALRSVCLPALLHICWSAATAKPASIEFVACMQR